MKCARCSAEIPAHSRFCLKCGTPVGGPAAGPVLAVPPIAARRSPNVGRLAAIALAVLLVAAAGVLGWRALMSRSGSRVAEAPGMPANVAPLTDRSGRVASTGPLVDRSGPVQAPVQRTDIMDYLRFLRQVETQRVALVKQQTGQILRWSSEMTAKNLSAEMGDDPMQAHRQAYTELQQDMATWQNQWQQISNTFLTGYPKPVPAECGHLRDLYFDVLKKTAGSFNDVANSFSQGMAGNTTQALDTLSKMRGSASASVDEACSSADTELGAVCDKYHLHKDFDIKPEGGAVSPLNIGM